MVFTVLVIITSCQQDSGVVPVNLPQTLSAFKASDKASQMEASFPGLSTKLAYKDFWIENLNNEEVYAVPAKVDGVVTGILYVGHNLKAGFGSTEFNGQNATITFSDLSLNKSVTWDGVKVATHLYKFDLRQTTIAPSSIAKLPAPETYGSCVTRVYNTAKQACDGDNTCATLCDNLPTCHTSMLISAAWTCL